MSLHEAKEAFFGATHDDPHCDVLIDRMAPFALEEALGANEFACAPLRDPIFNPTPNQSPLLVRIVRGEKWAVLDQLLELAWHEATSPDIQTRSVCAFIRSTKPLDTLCAHLTRQLDAHVADLGGVYFRYFDPRVAPQLVPLLTPQQYATWQDGIAAWHYLDASGVATTLPPVPTMTETETVGLRVLMARPSFSSAQWHEIEKIETVNLVLQGLRQRGLATSAAVQLKTKKAVDLAAQSGLAEQADRVAHALCELLLAEQFTRHPEYPSALALVAAQGVALMDVVEQKLQLHLPALNA